MPRIFNAGKMYDTSFDIAVFPVGSYIYMPEYARTCE